jgi:hypothetical protein
MGRDSRRRRYRRRVAHHRAAGRPLSWSPYRAYPRRVSRALYVLLGLVMGPLAFLAWTEVAGSDRVGWWIALVGGITILTICGRAATMGIFLSPAGVTVRNFFRTYHVPWGKVIEFNLDRRSLSVVAQDDVIICWSYSSPRPIPPVVLELFHRPTQIKLQADLREHAGRDAAQLRSASDR